MNKDSCNVDTLYMLCNKKQWFTCGTNAQYEKMFELASAGFPAEVIARIIWVCSDADYNEIYSAITASGYKAYL